MAATRMQRKKECILCRKDAEAAGYYGDLSDKGLHRHHVIFGPGYRSLSEKYGLWVYLCPKHHRIVHKDKDVNVELRQQAQKVFLKDHTLQEWMEIFTRNYLDENELNRIMTEQEEGQKSKDAENKLITDDSTAEDCMVTKEPPPGFWFIE